MALTVITTPRKNIGGYDSDAASTTQLLYKFSESVITPGEAYVLRIVIPELSNLERFYVPKTNGDIEFNIGPSVEGALFDAGLTNISYTLVYSSIRNGVETAGGTTIAILGVISKRQILSANGANLFDFILYNTDLPLTTPLTNFIEGRKWIGWAKSMYYINMDYAAMDVLEAETDINKTFIAPTVITPITPTPPGIISHLLMEPVDANAFFLEITLQSGLSLSKKHRLKYEEECKNPVMISWLNSLGGMDQWLFQIEQSVSNQIEEGRRFQTPITTDIETIRTTKGRFAPRDIQRMTLKVDKLNQNELQTLHEIKTSEIVRLWLNKDGSEYVGVIVSSGYVTDFTTGKTNYEFSLNIELPDNFDFFKAKLY